MYGDAYRDMTHYEIQQMLWRKVAMFADYANVEQRLPNGKRADVFYQCGATTIIIEVKIQLKESLFHDTWERYSHHCDYLVMAAPPQLIADDSWGGVSMWQGARTDKIGIWLVDWERIVQARPACRLRTVTPGHVVHMAPAWSPFTVIASPGCTADEL